METLIPQQELAQLFKDKIKEIKNIINYKEVSLLDKINFEIEIIKTSQELKVLQKVINEKEEYFKKYAIQFEIDYKEANQNFKIILEKVKIKAKTDKVVKSLLDKVDFNAVEKNKEVKVAFYKQFKKLV
jgi:hypothetical protein